MYAFKILIFKYVNICWFADILKTTQPLEMTWMSQSISDPTLSWTKLKYIPCFRTVLTPLESSVLPHLKCRVLLNFLHFLFTYSLHHAWNVSNYVSKMSCDIPPLPQPVFWSDLLLFITKVTLRLHYYLSNWVLKMDQLTSGGSVKLVRGIT